MLIRLCMFVVINHCFISVLLFQKVSGGSINIKHMRNNTVGTMIDMPLKQDLIYCLKSLEKVLKYYRSMKHQMDLNCVFGIFLAYDNIKSAYIKKHEILPMNLNIRIVKLLNILEELMNTYEVMLYASNNVQEKHMYSLIKNTSSWIRRLRTFEGSQQIEFINSEDNIFNTNIRKTFKLTPTPDDFDYCFFSLSGNTDREDHDVFVCELPTSCYHIILYGSDSGYILTHKLLLMLLAWHSKGCYIFSPHEDKQVADAFCEKMYNEAESIALNGFKQLDLLMEQMSLCALAGHSKILRRSWFLITRTSQMPNGCFSPTLPTHSVHSWRSSCNNHVNGVAAAMLGMTSRYILEIYY